MTALLNQSTGALLARHAVVARTALARMKGLLGRRAMEPGEALVLPSCSMIHTLGMRFAIDVVFLQRGRVVRALSQLPPGRLAWALGADMVVELPAGTLAQTGTGNGSQVVLG